MEDKEEEGESISYDESVCVLNSAPSEISKKENASMIDNERCKSLERIELSSSRSGCSKSCTEYKTDLKRARTSSCKPQTLRETVSRQKKSETKPSREVPLSGRLRTKLERTSKRLQSVVSPFVEKTAERTLGKMKSLYEGLRPRRALGFKCDLRRCDSTLMECSARACKKESMIFGGRSRPDDPETLDPSVSSSSTISSTSGES